MSTPRDAALQAALEDASLALVVAVLAEAVAREREACAKVCEDILREGKCTGASDAAIECAVSIRARSNT